MSTEKSYFNRVHGQTMEATEALSEAVIHPATGFDLQDRKFKCHTYKACFVGSEAVDWLVKEKKVSREVALELGETLRLDGLFEHVVDPDKPLLDGNLFYRFNQPQKRPPPLRGPPLVFIHGFKGSHLDDRVTGARQFLTKAAATNLHTPDLALPLRWRDGVQDTDNLIPSEPISKLLGVTVYGDFIKMARSLGRPFHCFAYDWRRDNNETAAKFEAFLRFLYRRYNKRDYRDPRESYEEQEKEKEAEKEEEEHKIQVVAHSNGGLITLAVLNRHPALFHSVLFAGTPFGPGIGMMQDLHVQSVMGLNKNLFAKPVSFSFPTSYCFFPLDPAQSRLVLPPTTSTKKEVVGGMDTEAALDQIPCDFFDPESWRVNRFGLYYDEEFERRQKKACKRKKKLEQPEIELTSQQADHLRNCLAQCKKFRQRLVHNEDVTYPPIAVLVGRGRPTHRVMVKNGPKSHGGWDFETGPQVDGDGRVTAVAALPPEGIPYEVFYSDLEHSLLLSEPLIRDILISLLSESARLLSK